jgi:prevent-host-death family protein
MLVTMSRRRPSAPAEVKAGEFKAKCLELMDLVASTGASIVITKRGAPVARLVPAVDPRRSVFGFARGSFEETGDIVGPVSAEWRPDEVEATLSGRAPDGAGAPSDKPGNRRLRAPRSR